MIAIKSPREVEKMRVAGSMVARAHEAVGRIVSPGVTTKELEDAAEEVITGMGGRMAFHGYRGFPGKICVSINEEVVHGIPGPRILQEGDIVAVDIGSIHQNYHGDGARTYTVGEVSEEARRLVDVCEAALQVAIDRVQPGQRLTEVSRSIQQFVEGKGYRVVEKYVGHGIGRQLHEDPQVPNYVSDNGSTPEYVLKPGMALAIEPMVNAGGKDVKTLGDGWTVVTADGALSAHFEHTILITPEGHEILTLP
jgi:methionyl aminopeptidase